jgi:hypothetical protein
MAVSERIREIFADQTAIIEPPSLEAYLDVTESLQFRWRWTSPCGPGSSPF